jgi:Tol biopolymer transport system component
MGRTVRMRLLGAAVVLLCVASEARAQYFGRNKVQYDRDDVRVLTTEHFDIYYASGDAAAALTASRLAERWYTRLSKVLEHSLTGRQPLILYGSHRTFEQTNVHGGLIDETTGGFTESRKRRIVLPFAASLAESDHVLGHEIVHAFQYDIAAHHRTGINLPLWFIEGLAEYLTLGPDDPLTSMWMRDAVREGRLPSISELSSWRYFPYRWGAALWSHLVRRFGPDLPARALRARRDVRKRLLELTGENIDELSAAWHEALRAAYAIADATSEADGLRRLISSARGGGRLNLSGSLSPDGRRIIFLSERDQFSVDLYLADAASGSITRRLITTAANTEFESLQYLHSAGGWDPSGRLFAIATVGGGRPALTLLEVDRPGVRREIPLAQLDEVYSPTWAPDGGAIAFSAMKGGVTDLFVIDLSSGALRQLTNDQFADLQPAWSPDGRTLAFATDRFSTDLTTLRFGAYGIGLFDVESGEITALPALHGANQLDPAWSPDGSGLYFVADPAGVCNVFRVGLSDGRMYRVTDVATGVSGVTRLSPALSVAGKTGALTFSLFRRSGYEIYLISSDQLLAGSPFAAVGAAAADSPPGDGNDAAIDPVPLLSDRKKPSAVISGGNSYRPKLSLEAIGTPYFSAGGGSFGSSVQGGASLLFGDLLGDRQLLTAVHLSSQLDESAFGALYVDRTARWNWGIALERAPEVRLRTSSVRVDSSREGTLTRERERWVWTHQQIGGFVAYPLNRSQRVELSGGVHQITFHREGRTEVVSSLTGRVLEDRSVSLPSDPSISIAEAGIALVGDTAVFGATGPMLGSRYRFQVTPAAGGLSYTGVLADYRRYLMPLRPYTIAVRVVHSGRYGADAEDARLREAYLGSSSLVRGYGGGAVVRSECGGRSADCAALNRLLGTGLLVAKLELRVPVLSAFSSRVRYGPLPIDAFVFADAGTAWAGEERFGPGGAGSMWIRSVGGGVRVNAMGLVLEVASLRPLDLNDSGWKFAFSLRPGF